MRLTRKIPGIRLPLPGHGEGARRSVVPVLPTSVWFVFLFVFLVTGNVGLFYALTDASATVFWMEPVIGGMSMFGLLTLTNALLAILVLGRMVLATTRQPRWAWKRALVCGVALSLLGMNQVYLTGGSGPHHCFSSAAWPITGVGRARSRRSAPSWPR